MQDTYQFLDAIGGVPENAVTQKDRQQVWNDVKRCEHVNPALLGDE